MGIIGRVLKRIGRLLLIVVIVVVAVLFAPGIPPHMEFQSYKLSPARSLEGNYILDKAEPLRLDRDIIGPESLALRGDDIFTGIKYGEIVKIRNGKVTTVTKTGSDCEGRYDEKICGRPLGLRFDGQGKLLVADAFYGILRVDVETGEKEVIVPVGQDIGGRPLSGPNDLDVDLEGNIYFSDITTHSGIDQFILELMGDASGRLIKYDASTKKPHVLFAGIHCANGVQLSRNQDFVMVNECARARVLRFFLKGSRKGEHEVFVDGLPGLPDNIRPNGKGGYYISHFMSRLPNAPMSLPGEVLGENPLVRKFILRVQHLLLSAIKILGSFVGPNVFTDELAFRVKNLGSDPDNFKTDPNVIILEIDEHGSVIRSLQNNKSKMTTISEVAVGSEFTYFGSPRTKEIWKIKNEYLKE